MIEGGIEVVVVPIGLKGMCLAPYYILGANDILYTFIVLSFPISRRQIREKSTKSIWPPSPKELARDECVTRYNVISCYFTLTRVL